MLKKIGAFDRLLCRELPLLLLLLVLLLLRLPNLFEPYWYGDEAIYLTIGNALKQGSLMYADIVDHKTPLIYYLATVPNQMWFRVLNIGWMIGATVAFYHIAFKVVREVVPALIASTFFVLLTTLPWFEGHIPNGELFVMGFTLWGGLLLLYTKFFSDFLKEDKPGELPSSARYDHPFQRAIGKLLHNTNDIALYLIAGILFGLGILTKVPALFDFLAFATVLWFHLTNSLNLDPKKFKDWLVASGVSIVRGFIIFSGVLIPIIGSIIYYSSVGTLDSYLEFGLLYNFRYVQVWNLNLDSQLLSFLFTMSGKLMVTTLLILVLTFLKGRVKPAFQFVAAWFGLAMFSTLLSNRPYPHYFLQAIPALALLVGMFSDSAWSTIQQILNKGLTLSKTAFAKLQKNLITSVVSLSLIASFLQILIILNVGLYETEKYYSNWLSYISANISQEEYYQSFNTKMSDNYRAAEIITASDNPYLFIWGDNAMLYALTQKVPVGRFTVAFHIEDFNAYQETIDDLLAKSPTFVVIMKDQRQNLPGLNEFVSNEYILNVNFENFELWKRI